MNPFIPKKLYDIFIEKLTKWASDHNFDLDKKTNNMKNRQKKVVSSTFHNAGIVVPYNNKTQLGYRPLIESDGNFFSILYFKLSMVILTLLF